MVGRCVDGASQETGTGIRRRGILAAAGAVVVGIVAKQVSQPVAAAPLSADYFSATGTTNGLVSNFDARGTATYGLNTGIGTFQTGVYGQGSSFGVWGNSNSGYGLYGEAVGGGLAGIYGYSNSANYGVFGESTAGHGVLGKCDAGSGIGVRGLSNLGTGVSGASNGNTGVFGTTTAAGFSALGGIVSTPNTAAFAGTATVPTAFAGFFTGDVFVNGNFTVLDPTRKHGAIAHPDGSNRILYSMESPESWLEDFGKGQLADGKAEVRLDPDFAAVAHTEDYHVFLTEYGETNGLYVSKQTASGFEVQERHQGTASVTFSWRVVAKPKTTYKAARMAKFVIPDIKVPLPPPMPNVPAPPVPDARPQAAPPPRPTSSAVPPAAGPQQGSGTVPASTTSPVQPAPPQRP